VFLVEMTEDMILDSMSSNSRCPARAPTSTPTATRSAFQNDETMIRAIAEHDHQMRHDAVGRGHPGRALGAGDLLTADWARPAAPAPSPRAANRHSHFPKKWRKSTMADIVLQRDVGSLGALKRLSAAAAATAAGTGDSTTTTGATIDRLGFGGGIDAERARCGVAYDATWRPARRCRSAMPCRTAPTAPTGRTTRPPPMPSWRPVDRGGGAVSGEFEVGST
jgi:hypothetical protein